MKTATRWQQRTDRALIDSHQQNQQPGHFRLMRFQISSRSARSIAESASRAAGRAVNTISQPPSEFRVKRNESRICRLMRLRATALGAAFLEMARPSRACCSPLLATVAISSRPCSRRPFSKTARNKPGFSSRAVRGNRCKFSSWLQSARRLRPFARRRAITLRPPTVAIRARKPWVRFRRRLCGWYVRFILAHSQDGKKLAG